MYKLRMRIVCVLATICMLVGSLQLPGNVRIVHASTTPDNVLLEYDFENEILMLDFESLEAGTAATATGWTVSNEDGCTATIQDLQGNKVLAVQRTDVSGTKDHIHFEYPLSETYDKLTLSYSIAVKDATGMLWLPALGEKSSIVGVATMVTTSNAKFQYTTDDSNWVDLKTKAEGEADFSDFGTYEKLQWHTVKMVYDKNNTDNPLSVYVNDKLANVVSRKTPSINAIDMRLTKWSGTDTYYIDNLRVTVGGHIDFAEPSYTVEAGKTINVSTTFAPASVADNYTVSYEMEDESVATVDTAGVVTGVTGGSTTITATATHKTNTDIKISATATVTVTAPEVDENKILKLDFENFDAGTAATATGWTVSNEDGCTATIQDLQGNKVLAVQRTDVSGTKDHIHFEYPLSETYDKLTLSYSIAVKDATGMLWLPALGEKSSIVGVATMVTTSNAKFQYTTNDSTWVDLTTKAEGEADFSDFGKYEKWKWYTVKMVYDKSNTNNPLSVYVNDELTNVVSRKTPSINAIDMRLTKWSGTDTYYIDNLQVTVNDHTPIVPAELTTESEKDPEDIPAELVNVDFEGSTSLPTGWTFNNPDVNNVSAEVKRINNNNVLMLKQGAGNASSNASLRYVLGATYDEVTLSYSVASKDNTGALYGPTVSGSSGGSRHVQWMLNAGKFQRMVSGSWSTVTNTSTMTWNTIKMVYTKGSDGNYTYDLYLNDTQLLNDVAADINDAVGGINMELYRTQPGVFYIDNIHMTTVDHTPVKPAELIYGEITGVSFTEETTELPVGGHVYLETTVTPADAEEYELTYSSSNPSVVTVDEWGEILALAKGEAIITVASAKDASIKDTMTVTVTEAPTNTTKIYVAVNGSADNDGSSATSPVTLTKAMEMVQDLHDTMTGNIEVILADGYYRQTDKLSFTEKHGGNNHHYVIYRHEGTGEAIIGGGQNITDFTLYDEDLNIYVADAKDIQTRQLYVDGVRAVRARSEGALTDAVNITDGLTCADTELLDYARPADLEMVFMQNWTMPRCGVASIVDAGGGRVKLVMDDPGWKNVTNKGATSATIPVYYENALELLDEPGEWYLDETADKLYYMPRPWEDMATVTVTAPVVEELVTIKGSSYDSPVENIRFEGITFADTTWMRPSTSYGHPDVQNNHIREVGFRDKLPISAVAVSMANSISFTDCTFTRIGITALGMIDGVQNSVVTGNHFFDISGTAVQVAASDYRDETVYNPTDFRAIVKNCDVHNNYIHDIAVDYKSAAAIGVGFAANCEITHNEIFNIPYSGIHIGYGWNTRFENVLKNLVVSGNFIHDLMGDGIYDGGAIYTLGNSGGDSEHYNLIYENYLKKQMDLPAPMYSDQGSSWYKWSRNVIDLSEVSTGTDNRTLYWMRANQVFEGIIYEDIYTTKDIYYDTPFAENTGAYDVTIKDLHVDENAEWDEDAQRIIAASGLQETYASLRNGQAERISTNLPEESVVLSGNDTFEIEVYLTDGKDKGVSGGKIRIAYAIDDTSIATVTPNGQISGVKAGKTLLRVYVVSNNILDVIEKDVYVGDELVKVALDGTEDTVSMSASALGKQLEAYVVTALGREIKAESVTYVIADTSIATVDENGYVKPVSEGETTISITANAEGKSVTTQFKLQVTEPITFIEDNAWELFDKEAEETWVKPSTATWDLVDDTKITTKLNGFATFTGKEYYNELLSFKLKIDTSTGGGNWPAIVLRAQNAENYVSNGPDGYIICMGKSGIEFHRFIGKMRYQIYGDVEEGDSCTNALKQGSKITDSKWSLNEEHDIQVGALSDGANVRILLKVDGETVIDYLDGSGAIMEAGYFGIVGRGETFTLTKNTTLADEPGVFENTTNVQENYLSGALKETDSSLKLKVLSEEDEAAILVGEDIKIYLQTKDISNTVSAADKALIATKLGDSVVGAYMDVSVCKQVGNAEPVKITNTKEALTVSVKIPDNLLNVDDNVTRTFGVIRVHGDKAEVLESTVDIATAMLEFMSDSYSTYALIYTDVKEVSPTPTPGVEPTPTPEVDSKPENDDKDDVEDDNEDVVNDNTSGSSTSAGASANTGDNSHVGVYIVWLAMSVLLLITLIVINKRKNVVK